MNDRMDETATRRRMFAMTAGIGGAVLASGAARAQTPGCTEDTLDHIQRTGVFNLGVREATPPYGFKDASGNYVGFATEMAVAIYQAVNAELGGKIRLTQTPVIGPTIIPSLVNGTIDMECGATVITQARRKVVDFAMPHFTTSTGVLVPADSPINSLADLAGKRIGVPQAGLETPAYRDLNAKKTLAAPVNVSAFPDHAKGVTALQTGLIDGYSSDIPILFGFAAKSDKWRVVNVHFNTFMQAFLIRPESSKFRTIADVTLANIFGSGQWAALYDKYFGPGSQAPMPMTDQLKVLELMNALPAQ
jgi:ABC-type amino acid transport substrate-binding protein